MTSKLVVNSIRHTGSSSDAVTLASDGTCTANITNNLSNRNLIINGAMQVAQRGTSSTTNGYGSVDRFRVFYTGVDENPTQEQADVASGTTPYTSGFRKCLKVTNGNQTGGAGAADYIIIRQTIEAQNLANSGWNYVSASSNITFSFWVKSSVAQNFYGNLWSQDGTEQNYIFETGSLSANTWTKVTKTIPGNSNLTFNNDTGAGLRVQLVPFYGTDKTGSVSLNTWAAYSGSTVQPDNTSTWYTTNDATLEITGVQFEVSDHATDFEHRSYNDEYLKCCRYYQSTTTVPNGSAYNAMAGRGGTTFVQCASAGFKTLMRANPTTIIYNGTDSNKVRSSGGANVTLNSPTVYGMPHGVNAIAVSSGLSDGEWYQFNYTCDAEL